jgi:hypothetical protein
VKLSDESFLKGRCSVYQAKLYMIQFVLTSGKAVLSSDVKVIHLLLGIDRSLCRRAGRTPGTSPDRKIEDRKTEDKAR